MTPGGLVRALGCGCAGRKPHPAASPPNPFGDDWSFRAPSTPSARTPSHRSQPSDSSADSTTPLRPALPPSLADSEASRGSPDTMAPDTFSRRVRHSTSQVVMYLRHRASLLLQPPRWG